MTKDGERFDLPKLSASDGYEENRIEGVKTESVFTDERTPTDDLALLSSLLRFASKNRAEELASLLLARFGSLNKVFSAKLELLMQIEGVNENIATLIRLVSATNQYLLEKTPQPFSLADTDKILLFLARLFQGDCDENLVILLFDKNGSFIKHKRISSGGANFVLLSSREILEFALREKAAAVIMSHNHPHGIAVPSLADKEATSVTRQLLSQLGIKLVAHYIIAGDQYSDCLDISDP